MASYVRPLLTYLERYENYKLMQVRVTSINDNVEFLKKKMYEASAIEIKAAFGLTKLMASAKVKEEILKDILTKIIEICLVINSQNINSKLQKRVTQVKGNKVKIKKQFITMIWN